MLLEVTEIFLPTFLNCTSYDILGKMGGEFGEIVKLQYLDETTLSSKR